MRLVLKVLPSKGAYHTQSRKKLLTQSEKKLLDIHNPDTITNVLSRCEDQDIYRRPSTPGNLLITPYQSFIKEQLQRGDMQATSIFQLLIRLGACLSLSTVTKAVRKIKYDLDMAAIRYETSPGQQAQADWASFKGFSATIDGIERPIYAFFMILGYSRMRYVEFVTEMTTMTLIRCIENAFTYYGGSTKEVLFDNMPQIVNRCLTTRDGNSLDRMLIPEFTAFADHIGFDITLCRIRRPQQKGKVERVVKYFKEGFMPMLPKKTGHVDNIAIFGISSIPIFRIEKDMVIPPFGKRYFLNVIEFSG